MHVMGVADNPGLVSLLPGFR